MIGLRILVGLALLLGLCWLASEHRDRIRRRDIVVGLFVQLALALVLLKIPIARQGFSLLTAFIENVDRATGTATRTTRLTRKESTAPTVRM